MKRVSMMTLTLFMRLMFKFNLDHDMEDLSEGYEEMLDLVSDGGFEWVDVTSWEIDILGTPYLTEHLGRRGLRVSSIIHLDLFAADGEMETAERVAKATRLIDAAEALDCDIFMLAPQAHPGIENQTPEYLHKRLATHCAPIVSYAKERNIHVVIENSPDLKLHLCSAVDVLKVLNQVEGLELVFDSANMVLCGEEPISYLDSFIGRIAYVHLKDIRPAPVGSIMVEYNKEGKAMSSAPTGTGIIDLPAVMKKLGEIKYSGSFSMEFFVDDDRDYLKSIQRTREFAAKHV